MSEERATLGGGLRDAVAPVLPWAVLATAALIAILVLRSTQVVLAWHLYVVVLGLLGTIALLVAVLGGIAAADGVSWRRLARRRRGLPPRLRSLQELEHAADFALTTAFDVHYRLRPHLRRIAAHRLANRGIRMDEEPERSRRLLGADLWELVGPEREPPENRNAPGLSLAQLTGLVDAIESV